MFLIKTSGIFVEKGVHIYVKFRMFIEENIQGIQCFTYFAFKQVKEIYIWDILFPGLKAHVPSVSNKNWVPGNN